MSREIVQLEGVDLVSGQTVYIACPWCGRSGKFGLTRNNDGLLYNCFSVNCGHKGFIPDVGGNSSVYVPPKHTRWIGQSRPLGSRDLNYFWKRFQLNADELGFRVTEGNKYLFPIRNRNGKWIGEVLRAPVWSGEPEPPISCHWSGQKALTYIDADQPRLHWCLNSDSPVVVLCEDQLSAEKVTQVTGFQGIALLGNQLGVAEAGDIAKLHPLQVIFWMDPDMNAQAFKLNAKFGGTMTVPGQSTVVFSDKDPKDHTPEEIKEILR